MHHQEEMSEVEIRQEARFVLWALRWCAAAQEGEREAAHAEVMRGFDLVDATDTAGSFWEFAQCLCQCLSAGLVWHGPACSCVSSGEMHVLHALAHVADQSRANDSLPSRWWRVLVPESRLHLVDGLARLWLIQLRRSGIKYPGAAELVEAMTPLHWLMDEAPAMRASFN
jgi:hypothetical protein